ncbi:molecular chaperone DnaJ [Paenibacillus elgii]|uniref:molecular chaperone DnaJ n=1 Tax=Paenibacillus elgii TaxID=189691 RepID=UPI0013D402E5|nr:molecular chaperone DnaJ [Paenibacillus elgii]
MKFFHSVTSSEEAKKLYRKLAFENHPDRGGDTEIMQQINREYDDFMERLNRGQTFAGKQSAEFNQQAASEQYRTIINSLIDFDGLDIEIIGTWIWVTGNTYAARAKLKELGFKWSSQKRAWYWHEGEYHKAGNKNYSLDEIKRMHDVQTVKKSNRMEALA